MSSPVTVTGKLVDSSGNPLAGTVSFLLSWDCWLADDTASIVQSKRIDALAAADGTFSLTLWSNADLEPVGSSYTVTEHYNGSADASYSIVVPHGGGNVAALITASPPVAAQFLAVVSPLAAADDTVVVGGTIGAPTVRVGAIAESQVTGLPADLADIDADIGEETTRATAAEAANAAAITSEATTARAAESANAAAITSEATTARAAEGANATAISTEITRAETAEATKLTTGNALSELTGTAATARGNLAVPPTSRQIISGTGLSGGGDLTANRTLAVQYGTTAGTATQGNDSRVAGAEQVANKGAASGYAGLDAATRVSAYPLLDKGGASCNAKAYGVVWDGVTDDTAALGVAASAALAARLPLLLPPGTGIVTGWLVPSGLSVVGPGSGFCVVKLAASATGVNTAAVDVSSTTGVSLSGLTIDGNLGAFSGVSTEHKHALNAQDVTMLSLFDVICQHAKGDGLYVGYLATGSVGVRADWCKFPNNYRNGCSIVDLMDGKFVACDFTGASGTAPQAGLDIEPNASTNHIEDLHFVACNFTGNVTTGLQVSLQVAGLTIQHRIFFTDCFFDNNAGTGVLLANSNDVIFTAGSISGNGASGVLYTHTVNQGITFNGTLIENNGTHGSTIGSSANINNVRYIGCRVHDNGTTAANVYNGLDFEPSVDFTATNVSLVGNTSGNRTTANQAFGLYTNSLVSTLTAVNNDFTNNATSASTGSTYNDDATTRARANNQGDSDLLNVAVASATLASHNRFVQVNFAGAVTITMPAAIEPKALYLITDVSGAAATNPITINPNGSQVFRNAPAPVINTNYGAVLVYGRSNSWYVLADSSGLAAKFAAAAAAVPSVFGIVRTPGVGLSTGLVTIGTASHTRCYRVVEGGTISKVRVDIGVSSGHICAQAFSNTGTGLTSAPGALLASSGSIASPGTGIQDIALGASVTLAPGDWLALGADNTTVTFSGINGAGDSTVVAGMAGDVAAFPAAANPTIVYQNNRMIELIGVP